MSTTNTTIIEGHTVIGDDEILTFLDREPSPMGLVVVSRRMIGTDHYLCLQTMEDWLEGDGHGGFGPKISGHEMFKEWITAFNISDLIHIWGLAPTPRKTVGKGNDVYLFHYVHPGDNRRVRQGDRTS